MEPKVTEDLIIRDSRIEDIEYFYKWELMPEVTKFFSISDNQSYETIVRTYVHDDDNPSKRQFTIVLKETGEPIGRVILNDLIEGWKVEILRIYIGELKLRGKGYGKQAMEALLDLAFKSWDVKRVYLDHYTGNPASHLYLSLGFKYEGVIRNSCRKNDKLYDVHLMSMLEDEYFQTGNI
ncbi:MAG: GNAT family N-acetyltransferase [Aminipila sp.]